MTPANISARQQSCSFMIARWPRDRAFYMGRFSMPLTIAVVLLGALTLNWLVLRRRERVSERTAKRSTCWRVPTAWTAPVHCPSVGLHCSGLRAAPLPRAAGRALWKAA